jgi:acetolactate synthase-1/2/3 large subunit
MQRETAVVADVEPAMLAPSYPGHMKMRRLHELLSKAERPLMILGGGGWTSQACDDLAAFAKENHIPTLVDFRRQDLLSNRHPPMPETSPMRRTRRSRSACAKLISC